MVEAFPVPARRFAVSWYVRKAHDARVWPISCSHGFINGFSEIHPHDSKKTLTFPTTFFTLPWKGRWYNTLQHWAGVSPLPHHHLLLLSLFSSPHSLQSRFCQSRPRARNTTNRMGHRTGVSNFGRDLTYSPYNPGTCICFGRGPGKF